MCAVRCPSLKRLLFSFCVNYILYFFSFSSSFYFVSGHQWRWSLSVLLGIVLFVACWMLWCLRHFMWLIKINYMLIEYGINIFFYFLCELCTATTTTKWELFEVCSRLTAASGLFLLLIKFVIFCCCSSRHLWERIIFFFYYHFMNSAFGSILSR